MMRYLKYQSVNITSEFSVIHSLAQGLGRAYQGRTFTGIAEQFQSYALLVVTNDWYGSSRN